MIEKAECMRLHSSCLKSWWEFAMETAIHVYNRTPLRRTNWTTPFENIYSKVPDVSYFKTFGCAAYVHKPKDTRQNKLSSKAELMTFIGYVQNCRAYQFMTKDNAIVIGVQAIFDELQFPRSGNTSSNERLIDIQHKDTESVSPQEEDIHIDLPFPIPEPS